MSVDKARCGRCAGKRTHDAPDSLRAVGVEMEGFFHVSLKRHGAQPFPVPPAPVLTEHDVVLHAGSLPMDLAAESAIRRWHETA